MSFGFSVGDFIAAGEFAGRIYKDIIQVARHATRELSSLQNEVAALKTSIDLLVIEVNDKDTILARSGQEKVKLVNLVLQETTDLLGDLEKTARAFDFTDRKAGTLARIKSAFDKTKFALEMPKIDALRAKLQCQNGKLNLILASAGCSSLQRVETMDHKIIKDIERLNGMMALLTHQPSDASALSFQCPLTELFVIEVEREGRRWFSYGFDEWVRAGRWWLMSSQNRLSKAQTGATIAIQLYADLLKASSILLDILPRHPSIRLWDPTKEYVVFQHLAGMLRSQLHSIEARGIALPNMEAVRQADLRIWTEPGQTMQLWPNVATVGSVYWDAHTEESLIQTFGTFTYNHEVHPEECMIVVLVSKKNISQARIVVQNQEGSELTNSRIDFDIIKGRGLPGGNENDKLNSWPYLKPETADCLKSLGNGIDRIRLGTIELSLSTEDLDELSAVIRGILFCQTIEGVPGDHSFLHGMILLFTIMSCSKETVRSILASCDNRRCLEFISAPSEILLLAQSSATLFLCEDRSDQLMASSLFANASVLYPELSNASDLEKLQCIYYWTYDICATLAIIEQPLGCFRPLKITGLAVTSDTQICKAARPVSPDPEREQLPHRLFPLLCGVAELAVIYGNASLIRHLTAEDLRVNTLRDDRKWTFQNRTLLIRSSKAIWQMDNPPMSQNLLACSPLHYAATFSSPHIVQMLLDRGGDPSRRIRPLAYNWTACECAIRACNTEVVGLLITGEDPIRMIASMLHRSYYLSVPKDHYLEFDDGSESPYARTLQAVIENATMPYVSKYGKELGLKWFRTLEGNRMLAKNICWKTDWDLRRKIMLETGAAIKYVSSNTCWRPIVWHVCYSRDLDAVKGMVAEGKTRLHFGRIDDSLPNADMTMAFQALIVKINTPYTSPEMAIIKAIIASLLEAGGDIDMPSPILAKAEELSYNSMQPLMTALHCPNFPVAKMLFDAGAQITAPIIQARGMITKVFLKLVAKQIPLSDSMKTWPKMMLDVKIPQLLSSRFGTWLDLEHLNWLIDDKVWVENHSGEVGTKGYIVDGWDIPRWILGVWKPSPYPCFLGRLLNEPRDDEFEIRDEFAPILCAAKEARYFMF
ncbi:uncharacterized protein PAC_06225 [Phialocephala subalpina]|uniref:Uncharacterized protein n=1 Tax=Phialocephala subalpina TaxID=576137 RepID=A0A1L7WU94_9HELO|nr:uncharacterized protein PAC_06225 [Phialocephala subalpina]